ncbi:MAG: hypothetical protein LUE21_10625 [Oscillospiraceae bacterium]|nr:hypothetical protein [Oscillospiraceae bacterium]
MDFTFLGADPRFLYLRRRLEADGHAVTADSGHIIAPPAMRTGIPYWQDEIYMIENAALTAEGALELLMRRSSRALMGAEALVAGYGRIGRFLAGMLSSLGVRVTVAARKPERPGRRPGGGLPGRGADGHPPPVRRRGEHHPPPRAGRGLWWSPVSGLGQRAGGLGRRHRRPEGPGTARPVRPPGGRRRDGRGRLPYHGGGNAWKTISYAWVLP